MFTQARRLFLGLALVLLTASTAAAVKFESLVMPGELIPGHAKYERDCTKCHALLTTPAQANLCLDCHKEVATDLSDGTGYHGRNPEISSKDCAGCHTEHKGRSADIVELDADTFAHDLTDFRLNGPHLAVRCSACHKRDTKYRQTPGRCVDCHRPDSPHKERLTEDCLTCHVDRTWSEISFDHTTTQFLLQGRHDKATCASCHPNQRYAATPTDCYSCHKLQDPHRGGFGQECHSCHSPKDWDEWVFDHDRSTDYLLEGEHRTVSCKACHKGKAADKERGRSCFSCHRYDDEHRSHYGEKCETCHRPQGWTPVTFDHATDTKYVLRGAHQKVRCPDCHTGDLYDESSATACHQCHSSDDPHDRQQGTRCEQCHQEDGWRENVAFEHDLARLPLLGLHATAPCEACHLSPRFKDADLRCASCHREDDTHEKRLGSDCGQCHNPNGWRFWSFNHTTQTSFPLTGGHEGLACRACHQSSVETKPTLVDKCQSCHATDDVHGGSWPRCQRCHVTSSFKETTVTR